MGLQRTQEILISACKLVKKKQSKNNRSVLVIAVSGEFAQRDTKDRFWFSKSKFGVKKSLKVANLMSGPLGHFNIYRSAEYCS